MNLKAKDSPSKIHLSVVATSRNDDHGDSLTNRMQHFVDGFIEQCRRHELDAELILVEWNPPEDRPPLIEALRWPDHPGRCQIRIITVPYQLHMRLSCAESLPLFQMIAKNVGIRRARGNYVLATNIDILFSDQIVRYMRSHLAPGRVYRADRCDVPSNIPSGVPFDKVLGFCRKGMFRINANGYTLVKRNGRWERVSTARASLWIYLRSLWVGFRRARKRLTDSVRLSMFQLRRALPRRIVRSWERVTKSCSTLPQGWRMLPEVFKRVRRWMLHESKVLTRSSARVLITAARNFMHRAKKFQASALYLRGKFLSVFGRKGPFTNGCGDFTLMSRDDWFALRGYPEWGMFSWHLDSVLLYQANRNGMKEVYVGQKRRIYHIEHGKGYTPEGVADLFRRLASKGIPFLTYSDFHCIVADMDSVRKAGRLVIYNSEAWGFAGLSLSEVTVQSRNHAKLQLKSG